MSFEFAWDEDNLNSLRHMIQGTRKPEETPVQKVNSKFTSQIPTPLVQSRKSMAPPKLDVKIERRLTLGDVKMSFTKEHSINRVVNSRRTSSIKQDSVATTNLLQKTSLKNPMEAKTIKINTENVSQNKPTTITPLSKEHQGNRLTPMISRVQKMPQSSPNGMISDFSKILKSPTSGYGKLMKEMQDVPIKQAQPMVSRRIDFKQDDVCMSSSNPDYYRSFKWYEPSDFVKTILKEHSL